MAGERFHSSRPDAWTLPRDFILRRWDVTVSGYGDGVHLATTRGKALADAWRSDAFSHLTFGQFLKIARCRLSAHQPKPDDITVSGERAYGLGHNRQYVQFVYPDSAVVYSAHPYDVLPVSVRPGAYQDRISA